MASSGRVVIVSLMLIMAWASGCRPAFVTPPEKRPTTVRHFVACDGVPGRILVFDSAQPGVNVATVPEAGYVVSTVLFGNDLVLASNAPSVGWDGAKQVGGVFRFSFSTKSLEPMFVGQTGNVRSCFIFGDRLWILDEHGLRSSADGKTLEMQEEAARFAGTAGHKGVLVQRKSGELYWIFFEGDKRVVIETDFKETGSTIIAVCNQYAVTKECRFIPISIDEKIRGSVLPDTAVDELMAQPAGFKLEFNASRSEIMLIRSYDLPFGAWLWSYGPQPFGFFLPGQTFFGVCEVSGQQADDLLRWRR